MTVRVLIADDQRLVREGLATMLGLLDGIEVVGVAVDGHDAVRQTAAADPDVVLMDLGMPSLDGIGAIERLVADGSRARIVVLTTFADDESVFRALRSGARGFLTKNAGAHEIRQAILTVAAGEAQLDPSVQRRVIETFVARPAPPPAPLPRPDPAPPVEIHEDGLTAREVEVLTEICHGHSNAEIAQRLFISEVTVKTHVNHLLSKTGQRDRAALVAHAFRTGRVRLP
ncbi:response regulator transcription factor [Dactylosporangium sp. NPDC000555]|uniref:response regulator transcription factor n=1 Tax=Dactylosporangium sp. NPDC000555 TaxID=3154260 RepID=UPI0033247239